MNVSLSGRPELAKILAALFGLVGIIGLGYYYSVPFPAPPSNASVTQVAEFASHYHDQILLMAWLQGTSSLFVLVFVLAVVHLAGTKNQFAGWMTMLASAATFTLNLVDVSLTIAVAQAASAVHAITGVSVLDFTSVFVHVFPILPAPLLFISLGAVLLASRLLPRALGYLALALGLAFAIVGFAGLFNTTALGVTTLLLVAQELWIAAAALTLILRAGTWPALHGGIKQRVLNPGAH